MGETAVRAERLRWPALYVLCAGTLMIVLDGSIVTVALPTIGSALSFSQTSLSWLVNAYMIAFGGLLLLSGRLGDLIGRKRMFLAGITLFTAASLLCGLSGSQEVLIAGRFLQGVGGAMASAVTLGMIVTMFTEPREQAKAIGVFSFVAAAGARSASSPEECSPRPSAGIRSSTSTSPSGSSSWPWPPGCSRPTAGSASARAPTCWARSWSRRG
ncbi:MFS transporter [Nonomuraea antimicrobica]